MLGKIVALALPLLLLTSGRAFAASESGGQIVFSDALYGAAIGGVVGGAAWLINQDNAGVKIGTGILVGTVAGLVFGVADAQSLVEVQDGKVKLALPTPAIHPRDGGVTYAVNLLHIPFE